MTEWQTQFGSEILTKEGKKSTAEVLKDKKRIGIYFSAHWCPPCRGFTPVLSEFYLIAKEENESDLEIIFVSSDQDKKSFDEYYKDMPWVSIPFENSSVGSALNSKYGVQGIPCLVILDETGAIKTKDGRSGVASSKGNTAKALKLWDDCVATAPSATGGGGCVCF